METAVNVKTSLAEMVKDGCLFSFRGSGDVEACVAAPAENNSKGGRKDIFFFRNVLFRELVFKCDFNFDYAQ